MVKNKTGRDMNPADAFRKVQRQKEIMRNKKERSFQRDAAKLKSNPDALKDELREVISMQEEGKVNLSVRLKQKAYKHALDTSIKSLQTVNLPRAAPVHEYSCREWSATVATGCDATLWRHMPAE
jgi:hypothetical protein